MQYRKCSLDEKAWQRITDVILGFLLNRNVPREDAENITNESLCIALEKYDPAYGRSGVELSQEEGLRRYAIRVAETQNRAFWRQRRRDKENRLPMQDDFQTSEACSPEQILQEKEERGVLYNTLRSLPAKDRAVLDLWSRAWSYNEIAHHLGTTRSAIKARINKARKKLCTQGRRSLGAL